MVAMVDSDEAAHTPAFPRRFGEYLLLEEIARGGMGIVYKAQQVELNRLVALKVIVAAGSSAPDFVRRFRVEAEAAAGLDHPNIVPIYHIGEADGQPFFTMKLVDGPTLRGALAPRRAAALVAKLARAVHHAHQRGIVHRDLKPNNVLVDAQGEPQLTDFGLARLVEKESTITRTIAVLGTPSYMAPEQARGDTRHLTTAADVYGLGAILYELIAGQPPFVGGTTLETIRQVLDKEPRRLTAINPKTDRDLETICLKCLEKEPQRRYGSAEALADDLERWLRNEPITARPASLWYRGRKWTRRHPSVAVLLALLLFSLGVGLALALWQSTAREKALEASRRSLYAARIGLVQQAWAGGHVNRARSLLGSLRPRDGQPDLRGFEWRYLWGICRDESFLTVSNLETSVQSVAVSPDGKYVAVVGDKPDAILWNVAARRIECRLPAPGGNDCVAFSPDGLQVAVAGADTNVRILDIAGARETIVLAGHTHPVARVAFSPDGKWLASASRIDGAVKVWAMTDKTVRVALGQEPNRYPAVAFSPDGTTLAWSSGDQAVYLTDLPSGEVRAKLRGHNRPVTSLAFSPNGKWLATGSKDFDARIWDARTGAPLATFPGETAMVTSVAFSPDNRNLLTAYADGTMGLWQIPALKALSPAVNQPDMTLFRGHEMWVNAAHFLPDGLTIVSGAQDGFLKFWESNHGAQFAPVEYHGTAQTAALDSLSQEGPADAASSRQDACQVCFCAGGSKLGVLDDRPIIQIWDAEVKHSLSVLPLPDAAAQASVLLPDGLQAVSAGSDNRLRLWNWGGPGTPAIVGQLNAAATRLAVTPDGLRLAVGRADGYVELWDTRSWKSVATNSCGPGRVTALGFFPDGSALLVAVKIADGTNALAKIRMSDGAIQFAPERHQGVVTALTLSPDARWVAGCCRDGIVRLWRSDSLVRVGTFRGHSGYVTSAAFTPDGRTLATAANDGTVRLWAVASREELLTMPGHVTPWTQVAFSPDGSTLVASGEAGLIRVWRAGE